MLRKPDNILWVFSGAIIVLTAVWAFFAYPVLDDYCFARQGLSPFDAMVDMYYHWSGRWLTHFAFGVFIDGTTFEYYWLPILIGLLLWWAGFVIALKDKVIGTVAFALFVAGMPSLGEGLFFYSNVIAYTAPFLLGVLAFRTSWPIAAACAFVVSGFSEFAGAFVLSLAVLKRDWKVAAAAIVGLLVNALAPGNLVRAEEFSHGSLALAAFHAFRNYDSVLSFVADPRTILFAMFLMTGERREGKKLALPAILLVSLAAAVSFVVVFGGPPPVRVLNFIYAAILIGVISFAMQSEIRLDIPRVPLAIALGLAMVTAPNIGAMVRDLPDAIRGEKTTILIDPVAHSYAIECRERFHGRVPGNFRPYPAPRD